MRRGKATVHTAFGEAAAVLAGDSLDHSPSTSSPIRRHMKTRGSVPTWCSSLLAPLVPRAWPAGNCRTS